MRLIDADALVWKIMVLCRSYQKTHLVHAEMLETFTNSVLAYIDHAEEHKTEVKVIQYDSNLPTEPSKSAEQNVENVPSGDLISRADAIDSINKTNSTLDEIPICKDIRSAFANAIKALPSADRPTEYNLETIADIVKQLGHLDGCIADMCGRPQVNSNSAEEQIAETCDRPKGEWVTDTTPTEEGFYLVTIEGIYGNLVRIMCRRKEYWCEFDDERGDIAYGDDEIFAWRPLPKPYSADRPQADPEPAPVVAYICDRRRCAICRGPDGGCDHTTDIKHAAHFKNVAGQYFERPYMEEEDDG